MKRLTRILFSVSAALFCATPTSATVLQYDLVNFAAAAERREITTLSDGTKTVESEIISDSERLARQVGIFAYQLRLEDTLLPFSLAGATMTLRQSERSSLVSATGERLEWIFYPGFEDPDLPAPEGLLSFKNYSAYQTSVFNFDLERQISSFEIYGDYDGEDVKVSQGVAVNSLFGGFLPPEKRKIEIVFSGVDLRFVRTPSELVSSSSDISQVPTPASIPMLLMGLAAFGLLRGSGHSAVNKA